MSCPGFGELNIPSSRAFWDDCEEDEFENVEPAEKLQLKFDDSEAVNPIASEHMIIIESPHIAHFASSALLQDMKRICKIPAKDSALYWQPSKLQLLAILEDDLTKSGEVTELLIPYARLAKKVTTLTLKPKVDYKSEEINKYVDEIGIVRSVGPNLANVQELEAPNFIAGVAAGIASWRDQEQTPINAYVIYTDKLPLDGTAAQPVLKLLQKIGLSCNSSYVPARKDSSYLYM
ncbi:uncharacterized protein Dwil_GK13860 [Drosophila willistoni]|uniref:Proteasome assembly chaperone 1 n=1 Tax=Drosophila willistoni TaxID=7260 RepID=B4NJH9_DROWI|nr:uncharacterized protein LOC6651143 [Drosophila willistoni]EDW83903.1 uncharacterized protein Dwil_GK13860 [Drosophila willistoni]